MMWLNKVELERHWIATIFLPSSTLSSVSAKIRNLTEFHNRLVGGSAPPSGLEILNTLRYFQQSLIGFLKEVECTGVNPGVWRCEWEGRPGAGVSLPPTATTGQEKEKVDVATGGRLALFPNLNYSGLFYAISNLIDAFGNVTTGQVGLGQGILETLKALYLFLERELVEQLPMLVANLLAIFPNELFTDILHLLCDTLLPFSLSQPQSGGRREEGYADASIPAVLMTVFQWTPEPWQHTWVVETLLALKTDIYKDVLVVLAMGTSESRVPAANLLLHYWPLLSEATRALQTQPHGHAHPGHARKTAHYKPTGNRHARKTAHYKPTGNRHARKTAHYKPTGNRHARKTAHYKPTGNRHARKTAHYKPTGNRHARKTAHYKPTGNRHARKTAHYKPTGNRHARKTVHYKPTGNRHARKTAHYKPTGNRHARKTAHYKHTGNRHARKTAHYKPTGNRHARKTAHYKPTGNRHARKTAHYKPTGNRHARKTAHYKPTGNRHARKTAHYKPTGNRTPHSYFLNITPANLPTNSPHTPNWIYQCP